MDNLIGKKLDGRYEILQLIGVGGMANVYKARDVIDERSVAVKILREEYASNEEFVRRFKNESKAIAALNAFLVPTEATDLNDQFPFSVSDALVEADE